MPGAIGFGPALALRRQGASVPAVAFDFTGGVLPAGAILMRGSAATRINAAGVLVGEAADVARFDFDPATLALRGLLVEPAATNLVPAAAAMGASPWVLAGATVAGSAAAPDGGMAAIVLRMPSGAVRLTYQSRSSVLTTGATYALSLWVRKPASGGADAVRIGTHNGSSFSTGISGRFVPTSTWTRVMLSGLVSNGTSVTVMAGNADAVGAADPLVVGDVELWGMQLEAGSVATRYVPTTSAAATRAADVLTLNWAAKGVADGAATLRYTFDDGSTQDVAATVSGGTCVVPVTLSRATIRRIEKI